MFGPVPLPSSLILLPAWTLSLPLCYETLNALSPLPQGLLGTVFLSESQFQI